jgi:tartrate-resistant acid phosphatase type 5
VRTTRREFLKQTIAFSALAALEPRTLFAEVLPPNPRNPHLLLVGDWGTDDYQAQQTSVAQSIRLWIERHKIQPEAMIMLGDNWYGRLSGGVNSDRWSSQFEKMYPATHLPGPVYVVPGNHDYERLFGNKLEAELDYARSRQTRWTMPALWYTFTFPKANPMITFLCMDTNFPGSKGWNLLPWSFTMNASERDRQQRWLQLQLSTPRTTPFVAAVTHHPLYSNGKHGNNDWLIKAWDGLFRQYKVDFMFSGHDHDLQHLEFEGHPTSFVISGGGGAELVKFARPPASVGQWGQRALGFSDLEVTPEGIVLRHIGVDATQLYAFRRSVQGKVTVLGA